MPYEKWYKSTIKKTKNLSDLVLYRNALIFGLVVFGVVYMYISYLGTSRVLNKAVADTAILMMGFSMLLSSICYFWDFLDSKIVYRKHLGLVGYAFFLIHLFLSWGAFMRLFDAEALSQGKVNAPLTGAVATVIFTIMAIVSNQYAARELGGKLWRFILRTGYVGVVFVWLHVVILKSKHWVPWYEEGMKTLPSMSLIVSVFMLVVVLMRILLWISIRKRRATTA